MRDGGSDPYEENPYPMGCRGVGVLDFLVFFSQKTLHIIERYGILFPKTGDACPPADRLGRYFLKGI